MKHSDRTYITSMLGKHGGYYHGPRASNISISESGFWNLVADLLLIQRDNCNDGETESLPATVNDN